MARAMKDSGVEWLGDIPADWRLIKLCYTTENIFLGRTPEYSAEPNANLTIGQKNNQAYGIDFNGIKFSTDNHALLCNESEYLKCGDILLNSLGTGSVGRVGYFDIIEGRYLTDGHIIVIRPSSDSVAKYTYYFLSTLRKKFEDDAVGSTNQAFLTIPKIYKLYLPFPPLDEQQRIADFLDGECARIDSIVEKTRTSIEEYKKLKQSIITQAVTKGIRPNRLMKDSGIKWLGDIPADWETIKLKYLFSIIGGNGFPDVLQGNEEGDYPFCKVSDINSTADYVDTASNWVSQFVVDSNQFNIVPIGSIIMAKIGAALRKNHRKINAVKCCIDNNTQALVPRRNDDLRYLLYLSKSIDMIWFDNNSTIPSINNHKLLNFFVPNVSKSEHREIAAYLDEKTAAIDSLIAKKNQLVTELESLKKSLIFEYVTGKKEVPT